MTYLLDTQAFLFWTSDSPKLGRSAHAAILRAQNTLVLSAVSSWEIAVKYSLGKLQLPETPDRFVPAQLRKHNISPIGIEHLDALSVSRLPPIHDDPFDRLLIAQALRHKYAILTGDSRFEEYGVNVVW